MADSEHKDVYIAAAVGGVALILIFMFLFAGKTSGASPAVDTSGDALPGVAAVAPAGQSSYNYNIAPFNPSPGIQYAANPFNNNVSGGGCCDSCGPAGGGGSFINPGVAQFSTLVGFGADAGAA